MSLIVRKKEIKGRPGDWDEKSQRPEARIQSEMIQIQEC